MIRHPNFNERHETHSPAYWAQELVDMKEMLAQINDYGGIDRLREDIRRLDHELKLIDGAYRWTHPFATTNEEKQG